MPELFVLLIPFATLGSAIVNSGLNRTRSATHSLLSGMCAASVAVLVFVIAGSALTGPGSHLFHLAGKAWGWAGNGLLFSRSVHPTDAHGVTILLFQLFAASLTAQIPVAAGAERWRLSALCLSTAILAALLFPFVAYWSWGGGFLSQLGVVDSGGAGVIQVTGGFTALVIAWLLGPRQGKFTPDGIPTAMPGHNALLVVIGSLLSLLGWAGLSASGSMLFYNNGIGGALFAVVNTTVAAAAGAIAALITTRIRFGKPDTSLTANGWVAGMVAISAAAASYNIAEALMVGLAAGVIVVFAMEIIELRMHVDDPAGAIAVHAAGGILGLLAAGIFVADGVAQLLAVGTLLGFVIPVAYAANSLINQWIPFRLDPVGERQGIDLHELGSGAYPEFVIQRDEFLRR